MTAKNVTPISGKVVRTETTSNGHTVELRYAEFGDKTCIWRIFRDGEYAGNAAVPEDVEVNFNRVLNGYVLNPETGNYERAEVR
jgi:hypothetical protein